MRKNEKGEPLVEHHTHYKEIDGYDKTIWMTRSEHIKLHNKLRREKKCNIPPEELRKISVAALHRTDKVKERKKEWREKNKEKMKKIYAERYKKNREKILAKKKSYYEEHKEEIKAKKREYRARKKILENGETLCP